MKNPFAQIRTLSSQSAKLREEVAQLRLAVQQLGMRLQHHQSLATIDAGASVPPHRTPHELLQELDAGRPISPQELSYCARVAGMGTLAPGSLDSDVVRSYLRIYLGDHHVGH